MDVVSDRYIGLTALSTRIWQGFESGLSIDEIAATVAYENELDLGDAKEILSAQVELWKKDKIVAASPTGADDLPNCKDVSIRPSSDLISVKARFSGWNVIRLIIAIVWTHLVLKRRGLPYVLKRLQLISIRDFDQASFAELGASIVASYKWIRLPFRQGADDCLQRSLVLMKALRDVGIDAQISFGVQKFPFFAHAWVEAQGVAMNESLQVVRKLSVIARF